MDFKKLYAAVFGIAGVFVGLIAANVASMVFYEYFGGYYFPAWVGIAYMIVFYLLVFAILAGAAFLGYKIGKKQEK